MSVIAGGDRETSESSSPRSLRKALIFAVLFSMAVYRPSTSLLAAVNWIGQMTISAGYSRSARPLTVMVRSYSLYVMAAFASR